MTALDSAPAFQKSPGGRIRWIDWDDTNRYPFLTMWTCNNDIDNHNPMGIRIPGNLSMYLTNWIFI